MIGQSELIPRFIFFIVLSALLFCAGLAAILFVGDAAVRLFIFVFIAAVFYTGFKLATFRDLSNNRIRLAVLVISFGLLASLTNFREQIFGALLELVASLSDGRKPEMPSNVFLRAWTRSTP